MKRKEAIKHLIEMKSDYEPEIYAKDTLHKRQALIYAIAVLEGLDGTTIGKVMDVIEAGEIK